MPIQTTPLSPWSSYQSNPNLAALMLRAQTLRNQQAASSMLNAIRQQTMQTGQLRQQEDVRHHQVDEQQTGDLRSSQGSRAMAAGALDTQKLQDLLRVRDLAKGVGESQTRLMLPDGNPIQAGNGPTKEGGQQLDMANQIGQLMELVARKNPNQLLAPHNSQPGQNVQNEMGQYLQKGVKPDIKLNPGQELVSGDDPTQVLTQVPNKPSAAKDTNSQLLQLLGIAEKGYSGATAGLASAPLSMKNDRAPILNNFSNAIVQILPMVLKAMQGTNTPAATAQPQGSDLTGVTHMDGSGRKWRYKGSATDPMTDQDPSNWEQVGQ